MNYEEKYDHFSESDIRNMDVTYAGWIAVFEEAKNSGDDQNVYRMISSTESKYCIWKILQYLKSIAVLENSDDSAEHWRGFLAKANMQYCRSKLAEKVKWD